MVDITTFSAALNQRTQNRYLNDNFSSISSAVSGLSSTVSSMTSGLASSVAFVTAAETWTSYSPTFAGLGVVTLYGAYWRQDGKTLDLLVRGKTGAGLGGTTVVLTMPSAITTASWTPISGSRLCPVGNWIGETASTFPCNGSILSTQNGSVVYFGTGQNTPGGDPHTARTASELLGDG